MKVKYVEEPSIEQIRWGANDDPRDDLVLGEEYEAELEVHSWHTKVLIGGKRYNGVSFEYDTEEWEKARDRWAVEKFGTTLEG